MPAITKTKPGETSFAPGPIQTITVGNGPAPGEQTMQAMPGAPRPGGVNELAPSGGAPPPTGGGTPITEQQIRDQFQQRFQKHYGAGNAQTGDWETAYKNEAYLYGHGGGGGTQEDLDKYFTRREGELGLNKPPAAAAPPPKAAPKPVVPPPPPMMPPPGGGGGGAAGGGGMFDNMALPQLQRALQPGIPQMMPMPQNLSGESEGNPELGNRILPMQQLKLALSPNRIY